MNREIVALRERHRTFWTRVWPFSSMGPHVPDQVRVFCKAEGTQLALEWPLSGVNAFVHHHSGALYRTVATERAPIQPLYPPCNVPR